MAKDMQEPVFVNLQSGPVQVFNEKRRPVRVAPWANRNRQQSSGVFEVTGEHYRQFVGPRGPLFPRPAGAGSAAPTPSTTPAADETRVPGDPPSNSDDGKKKTDPKDLSAYTVVGAVEQIETTEDVTLLKAWGEAEAATHDRKGVMEAVEKRLAELA